LPTFNGALTVYVYDGDAIVLEYDGTDALQATYSHGEEVDQPLAMTRGAESFFYHTDHLGSIRLLTDGSGNVARSYDYDAFGNWEDTTSYETVANPFGFTARERDAESGLMFYRARYCDPKLGRFISEDPMGFEAGDLNLYRYVNNLPTNLIDSYGTTIIGGTIKWFRDHASLVSAVQFIHMAEKATLIVIAAALLPGSAGCQIVAGTIAGTIMATTVLGDQYKKPLSAEFIAGATAGAGVVGLLGMIACALMEVTQEL